MKLTFRMKSFEGHKGRPGQVGGSVPKGGMGASPKSHARPVEGLELYSMQNEDRPSWGVHGGDVRLYGKGLKILNFIGDNSDYFEELSSRLEKPTVSGMTSFKFAWNSIRDAIFQVRNSEDGRTIRSMASHEASGLFDDVAFLWNKYISEARRSG